VQLSWVTTRIEKLILELLRRGVDRATEIAFPEMQLLAPLMEKTPLLSQSS
jgi:hypothetical protein